MKNPQEETKMKSVRHDKLSVALDGAHYLILLVIFCETLNCYFCIKPKFTIILDYNLASNIKAIKIEIN